nr:MAG TPA_asm: major capsid protein [Caudoviricetes sp.]
MTIQELMEKRAKVWEAAKNFVDTHENENGVLSAEDSATYERMEAEIEDLTKAIVRLVVVQTLMWDKSCIRTKIDG